jgi:uncharacterized damage-inducible protein DinB
MYRTIEDFKTDWAHEGETTAKVFGNLTDASLGQRVTPEHRTLGFLAWHIVVSLGMATEAGLPFEVPGDYASQPPAGAAVIKSTYEKYAAEMVASIEKNWKDANLLEQVQMYGLTWTRGYALLALVKHQAHHRGQMTVLMRQAGLLVPGAYGPAKEEWAAAGMEALP